MGERERTILRIRCSRELFRRFRKLAVDYEDYELALDALLNMYDQYPDLIVGKGQGRYSVTRSR